MSDKPTTTLQEPIIRLGISKCLLGENVRYDGGHKRDPFLIDELGRYVQWVPVCPEVECGMPTPRGGCAGRAGRGLRCGRSGAPATGGAPFFFFRRDLD